MRIFDEELQESKMHLFTIRELEVSDLNEIARPLVPVQPNHEQHIKLCEDEESRVTCLLSLFLRSLVCIHLIEE